MDNTFKTIFMGAAGAGGESVDVADVFSTDLYTGNGSTQTITNGIDLDGEGGLVWGKSRSSTNNHVIFDSERGLGAGALAPNLTNGNIAFTDVTAFNSNGFTLDNSSSMNASGANQVAWTFRKAPKFFDVVTYTGDGVAGRTVAHDLGSVPGMIIVKRTSGTEAGGIAGWWSVYHRGLSTPQSGQLFLNSTSLRNSSGSWNNTLPTDEVFSLGTSYVNYSGDEYVAYLFAHDTEDDNLIQCGSYTGNGSSNGPEIDLGWEPQWLLVKNATSAADWVIQDVQRGMIVDSGGAYIKANDSAAEFATGYVQPEARGFKVRTGSSQANASGDTYIYVAIRGPMMKEPESATEVYNAITRSGTGAVDTKVTGVGFSPDLLLSKAKNFAIDTGAWDRLRGPRALKTSSTATETNPNNSLQSFDMDGYTTDNDTTNLLNAASSGQQYVNYFWKRAKGYFDVVAYAGNSVAGRTVAHSLGVVPEMMWVKARTVGDNWIVYHNTLGPTKHARLNEDQQPFTSTQAFNNTAPTDSVFTLGTELATNYSSQDYIAYLLATLAGISKVGSYTGNGSNQTIDCGFTSGARFILIKRTDSAGDWYVWDSVRGIIAGNDPHLALNSVAAEVTTDDSVDPNSSGFIVNQVSATNINVSAAEYIFYAIA